MAEHNEYGKRGEEKAAKYLINSGYKILCKNYKTSYGEIDIIALETKKVRKKKNYTISKLLLNEDVIVFVEVKARKNYTDISPSEAVDTKRQLKYYYNAEKFLRDNNIDECPYRFDIIEVFDEDKVNHIEKAF